jgi:hypothetical protein
MLRGWVYSLQLLLGLDSAVFLGSEFRRTLHQMLLSQILNSPSLVGKVPIFISPRNRVAQLHSLALGLLSNETSHI